MKQQKEALLKIALIHTHKAANGGEEQRIRLCVNGAYLRGDQALHGNFIKAIKYDKHDTNAHELLI